MSTLIEDQSNALNDVTILFPGDSPQGTQDNATPVPAASPAGDDEHFREAYEAAGIKPPEPKPQATTSTIDPTILEALRKLDPTTLPPDLQEHLDRHFQPPFTKKTQALAEEKRAFEQQRNEWFAVREKALAERERVFRDGADTGVPDRLAELREKAQNGDPKAFQEYVDAVASEKVAPIQSTMKLREAYETAEVQEPLVRQHAEAIGKTFADQPELLGLLSTEGYRYAPLIFRAIARDIELSKAQTMLATFEQQKQEAVSKALAAYRQKVMGLPSTTTQAGTTLTAPAPAQKPPATFEAAREKTLSDLRNLGLV